MTDAELLAECTFFEVGLPLWVKRVRLLAVFNVPPDFGSARPCGAILRDRAKINSVIMAQEFLAAGASDEHTLPVGL